MCGRSGLIEITLMDNHIRKLALANSNPQRDLIQETNSGIIVRDRFHLKEILKELHHEHATKGFIECESKGIEKYSRKIQAERLAGLIRNIISG